MTYQLVFIRWGEYHLLRLDRLRNHKKFIFLGAVDLNSFYFFAEIIKIIKIFLQQKI